MYDLPFTNQKSNVKGKKLYYFLNLYFNKFGLQLSILLELTKGYNLHTFGLIS